MANESSSVNIAAAPGIIQPLVINAAPSLQDNRPPKRPRVKECRAVTIARQAREDDALYRALLVRILRDQYIDGDDKFRIRKDDGTVCIAPNTLDPAAKICDNFTWSHYPVLEHVLRSHMEEYYEMSWTCAQSKQQQLFNNHLVRLIYHTATVNGYTFDPESFSGGSVPLTQRSKRDGKNEDEDLTPLPKDFHWKKLRDRIRCYYKTHVQNSKKRLSTMIKNPHKARNRDALLHAVDLIKDQPHLNIPAKDDDRQVVEVYHPTHAYTGEQIQSLFVCNPVVQTAPISVQTPSPEFQTANQQMNSSK